MEKFRELNENLYNSANKANLYGNMLGPVNAQLGNISYVVCAIVGGIFAIYQVAGLTLGGLASFLTFNKSINMPINQVSQQLNSIVMALAGAERIFRLLDEQPELAAQFHVMSIPSLFVLKNGKIVNQAMGARPKQQILAMMNK